MKEIQTEQPKNFVIIQDGEWINQPEQPNPLEIASSMIVEGVGRAVAHVRLESRMLVFDTLHGTQYRHIRHELVEQKKRAAFEASIGLVAINKKTSIGGRSKP